MAGLNKEIWLADIKEQFMPNTSFLSATTDMSAWVENDVINLAEAGIEPNVLINNATYPVAISDRADAPIALTLDVYDTENVRLRNAELVELAYDKRTSVMNQLRNALVKRIAKRAAWMYTPATTDATKSNKVVSLGAATFDFDVIIDAGNFYDEVDAPEDRVMVLSPAHMASLRKVDSKLYKEILNKPGTNLYGFDMYTYSQMPKFSSAGVKNAFGAASAGTDLNSTCAFLKSEVMSALGSIDLFDRLRDPEARADIIGLQQRALVSSIRGKYQYAILK